MSEDYQNTFFETENFKGVFKTVDFQNVFQIIKKGVSRDKDLQKGFQTQETIKRTIKRPFSNRRPSNKFLKNKRPSKVLSETRDLQKVFFLENKNLQNSFQRHDVLKGGFLRQSFSKGPSETGDY